MERGLIWNREDERLSFAAGAAMVVAGTNPGRHRGLVGAGVKARLNSAVDVFVNYNLEFRNRYTNHNVMAGLGVSF